MRLVEGESLDVPGAGSRLAAILITGDGRTEVKVVEALAERIGCQAKAILDSTRVLAGNKLARPTGLDPALRAVSFLARRLAEQAEKLPRFLVLADREHVKDDPLKSLKKYLESKVELVHSEPGDFAELLTFNCRVGDKEMTLHLVILGRTLCTEECLLRLLELETGEAVPRPRDSKSLKKVLENLFEKRGYGGRRDLLKRADEDHLEAALGPLLSALRCIKDDP